MTLSWIPSRIVHCKEMQHTSTVMIRADIICLHSQCTTSGHLGGQYVQSDMPMQGRLMWDEDSQMDLVNLPERELAVELACLVNAANGPWKMKPSSSVDEGAKHGQP